MVGEKERGGKGGKEEGRKGGREGEGEGERMTRLRLLSTRCALRCSGTSACNMPATSPLAKRFLRSGPGLCSLGCAAAWHPASCEYSRAAFVDVHHVLVLTVRWGVCRVRRCDTALSLLSSAHKGTPFV